MKNIRISIALSLVLLLCACGGITSSTSSPNDQPDVAIPSVSNHMKYDGSVSSSKRAALNEAISVVHFLPMSSLDNYGYFGELLALMKIPDTKPATLHQWLEDRVTYVVDESYNLDDGVSFVGKNISYPDAYVIPDSEVPSKNGAAAGDSSEVKTMMLNIGGEIYYAGKSQMQIAQVKLSGIGIVDLISPRVGLLQIGEGLFQSLGIKGNVQNITWDIFRAGVLFHEARHSDGHGLSLGFFHSNCPDGDYKGLPACDAATNGAYTVGANMILNLSASCSDNCTEKSKSILRSLYFDQASRTLTAKDLPNTSPGTKAGTDWDDAPEKVNHP